VSRATMHGGIGGKWTVCRHYSRASRRSPRRRLADPRMAEGQLANQDELDAAVDEMFTDETRGHDAVVVVRAVSRE